LLAPADFPFGEDQGSSANLLVLIFCIAVVVGQQFHAPNLPACQRVKIEQWTESVLLLKKDDSRGSGTDPNSCGFSPLARRSQPDGFNFRHNVLLCFIFATL